MPAPERRRVALSDYNDLSHRAGLGDGYTLPLGTEDVFPDLATLRDGEPIYVTDNMELWSAATARLHESAGRRYWYAADIPEGGWDDLPLPADADTSTILGTLPAG